MDAKHEVRLVNQKAALDKHEPLKHLAPGCLRDLAVLGRGAYGVVKLMRVIDGIGDLDGCASAGPFAVKVMQKALVLARKQTAHVIREKQILQGLQHSPFIMRLHAVAADNRCLYFVTEYLQGGDVETRAHDFLLLFSMSRSFLFFTSFRPPWHLVT
jgi:serine/threonine protein kinase